VTSDDQSAGRWDGDSYQRRFDTLAASGTDVHGEAALVARWKPATVLDAGCGTGRVARELTRRGIDTVGVDLDPSMIATARRLSPELDWVIGDMAVTDLHRCFDVVVMAGNVPLFTDEESRLALVAGCARHLAEGGRLVAGFQLDRHYGLNDYDDHCQRVVLDCTGRWATWSGDPYEGGSYAVSVHQRAPDGSERGPQ
jgi:SAM-dependent methyltransferase